MQLFFSRQLASAAAIRFVLSADKEVWPAPVERSNLLFPRRDYVLLRLRRNTDIL